MFKEKYLQPVIILCSLLILGALFVGFDTKGKKNEKKTIEMSSSSIELSNDEIKFQLNDTLDVLMRIHYVSIFDKKLSSSDTVILDELQEAMDDVNKLSGLLYKTELLSRSKNKIINTTGLVLNVSVKRLIQDYDTWIKYLRSFDINNIDMPEFQYQLAQFQSSTHDVYLTLLEGASLLPMVTVEFAKEEGGKNSFNENLKTHFLSEMDKLFEDILQDDEAFHRETNNRYAIAVLIRGYKDFFAGSASSE